LQAMQESLAIIFAHLCGRSCLRIVQGHRAAEGRFGTS
jgi:hypothetical protein